MNLQALCHRCGMPVPVSTDRHVLCPVCASDRQAAARRLSMRCHRNRLRAYKAGAAGFVRASDVRALWRAQKARCAYCRRSLGALYASPPGYHIEHRVPLCRGGDNAGAARGAEVAEGAGAAQPNVCLSCPTCNARKGTMTDDEFTSLRDDAS